jgi:type IV pilus assembly protein PilY1
VDQAALNRLQNIYGLTMPHEIKRIHYRMNGQSDHVFVGAPSTEPNWWILGFEDLYDHGDRDFNDLVFLVFRTNGGESVSNVITDEMSAQEKAQSTITKVRFQKNDHIPIPPCSSDPDKVRIEYYVAIDTDSNGDPNWILVQFPPTSPDEVVLDMQELGVAGTELRWKAVIISDDHDCKPEIRDVNVGYEALKSGEYLFSSPLLLANALYRGGLETRSTSWTVTGNDYSNRGHFRMYELYEPETPDQLVKTPIWDAGERLAGRDPDSRTIWTNNAGNTEQISASASNWVLSNVLSPAARAEKLNSKPVYDLDADGDSDDDDARRIIQWTRGWESPGVARAWKLGPIHKSTAAVVHLPGEPEWLNKTGVIPSQARTEYVSWAGSSAMTERDTVAYVGAQDGMLHAFDAGSFRWGDNPHTNTVEHRGYFQYDQSAQAFEYGSGEELWAFVPPSQLGNLKNNKLRNYYPEVNAPAMVDGSVVVSDVYGVFPFSGLTSKAWRTAIFFTLGTQQPYLSALDVTNPQSPRPLWTDDWTDVDFQGTSAAPTVHWIEARVSGGADPTWGLALSSGLATTPADVFLYLLDVPTGNTLRKVQLNQGSGTAGSQAYGVAGRPVLVDRDDDGVADRVYVADTNGRIWRHNLDSQNSANACLLAEVGQPIYHTPGVIVREDSTSKPLVALYFGTGDDPRQDDTPNAPYWIYAMVDEDETAAQCTPASLLYKYQLPSDEKVWGDPSIAAERVYFGTSTGDKAHLCDEDTTNPGHVYTFELDPTSPGVPSQPESPVSAGGNVVSGLMVYDQHVVLNTVGGQTTLIGGSTWNNLSGLVSSPQMKDVYWNEVLNK